MNIPNQQKQKRRNPHVIVVQRRNIIRKNIVIIHPPLLRRLTLLLHMRQKRRNLLLLQIRKDTTIEDENIKSLSLTHCRCFHLLFFVRYASERKDQFQFFVFLFQMRTISFLYRCMIEIFFCLVNLTQWTHGMIRQFLSRHRYTITVNIGVSRNDPRNEGISPSSSSSSSSNERIQFNKPTDVLAIIINEQIPDDDLCKFIVNAILFFRTLNLQHLIIYDYQGE